MYQKILRRIIAHPNYAVELVRRSRQRQLKICPHCGVLGHRQLHHTDLRGIRTYRCSACSKTYSELIGTVFFQSKLPLHIWLQAILYWCMSTGSLSAAALGRMVGISHLSAWRMLLKIRVVLAAADPPDKLLTGLVEIDEAWFGKRTNQEIYFGMVERNRRKLVLVPVADCSESSLIPLLKQHVQKGSVVNTDSWSAYNGISVHYDHQRMNHSRHEFVRGTTSTNTIERIWGMMKGILRTIHHGVSKRYRQLYIQQFIFKFEHEHSHNLFNLTLSKLFSPTYCLI